MTRLRSPGRAVGDRRFGAVRRWAPLLVGGWMLAALVAPGAALAHATLVRADPADRAVLSKAPQEIRLTFDDTIRPAGGSQAVRSDGSSILGGSPRVVGGRQLVLPLRAGLGRGDYTVLWRARSDDGHTIAGLLTFAVGEGRPPPRAALNAPSEANPIEVVARWLLLAGVLVAAGAALFSLALRAGADVPGGLYLAGFLLVVAGGPTLAGRASLSTRFGLVVAVGSAVAATGALLAVGSARRPQLRRGVVIAALLLLLVPSLSGHALDAGRSPFELPVDLLHVAASSVWLGGLLALALGLRANTSSEPVIRAFSSLAAASVAVLAATGVIRAFDELSSLSQAWSTGYGRLLLVKTGLLGALVCLGWVNRHRLIPALMRSAPRLRRNLLAEIALFAGLVTAVALLTQARPGVERASLATPAAAATRRAAPEAEGRVLAQRPGGLELAGAVANATAEGAGHVVWESLQSEEGANAALFRRDLRARRTTTLAKDAVAPAFGLAVAAGQVVYAAGASPPRLVAMPTGGGRQQLLARRLIAPVASRGTRVAWAEQQGDRQRITVRDMASGKAFLAADLPACEQGSCYRIDGVTLADGGVVVARGAIGPQPSLVLRRSFARPGSQSVELVHDPQPDLVPSSAGAAYYALGRGWYRWDFGARRPLRARYGAGGVATPIAYDAGRWYVERPGTCNDTLLAADGGGLARVAIPPRSVLAMAGNPADVCARFRGLTGSGAGTVTTWAVSPSDPHSEEGTTGVITLGRPGG